MTLHYYDEIDILKPTFVSESGRRYYSDQDLITKTQQLWRLILIYTNEPPIIAYASDVTG